MSTPTAICLDTQVYERLNFNFSSPVLQEFVKLSNEHKLKLLVPAPIADEVHRHMVERAKEFAVALDKVAHDAQRKYAFLSKWERFPLPSENPVCRGPI